MNIFKKQSNKIKHSYLLPKNFEYLFNTEYISYKDIKLNTVYAINIINDFVLKYILYDELYQNIYSIILKNKYGKYYKEYLNYLVDLNFITLHSEYYVNKKTRTYKINEEFLKNINIYYLYLDENDTMNKKHCIEYNKKLLSLTKNHILNDVKNVIIDDLYHVSIDRTSALKYIDNFKNDKLKYLSNLWSIENIHDKNLFFKFDNYGRFHTNFTILNKNIRRNYLKIDDYDICEIDIKNSQPLFLIVLLNKHFGLTYKDKFFSKYCDVVFSGIIYEDFKTYFNNDIKDREHSKEIIYRVIFGNDLNAKTKYSKMFKYVYPEIFNYIVEYKRKFNNYKEISYELQRIESDFVYNKVVNKIIKTIPGVHLFTVHDSINVPNKYKNDVEFILKYELNNLKVL